MYANMYYTRDLLDSRGIGGLLPGGTSFSETVEQVIDIRSSCIKISGFGNMASKGGVESLCALTTF